MRQSRLPNDHGQTTTRFTIFAESTSGPAFSSPFREVLETRRGVCQDFAHLRSAPCDPQVHRPVRQRLSADRSACGQASLIRADASRAWINIYCSGVGCLDDDPTANQVPSLRHGTVAWARDYSDVCTAKGVALGGGQHLLSVAVDVSPLGLDRKNSHCGWRHSNNRQHRSASAERWLGYRRGFAGPSARGSAFASSARLGRSTCSPSDGTRHRTADRSHHPEERRIRRSPLSHSSGTHVRPGSS